MSKNITKFKEKKTIGSQLITYQNRRLNKIIDNLMSELEDAIATGESITVNDSANALASIEFEGNTKQTQYEGNQLIDFANSISRGGGSSSFENDILQVVADGSRTYQGVAFDITNIIKANKGKTLYLNFESFSSQISPTANVVQLNILYNDTTPTLYFAMLTSALTKRSYAIPSETENIREADIVVYANNSSSQIENIVTLTKPLLQFGTEELPYEPYVGGNPAPNSLYPQTVQILKGNNELRLTNKNQFCKENAQIIIGYIDANIKTIAITSSARTIYIPCNSNTSYTISKIASSRFRIADTSEKPEVGVSLEKYSNNLGSLTEYTYTTSNNAKYLCVFLYHANYDTNITLDEVLDSLQIEVGTNKTDYIEGKEQTYPITLPTGMEMCGIEDSRDEFVKDLNSDKWYKSKKIGKSIFDGSNDESWYYDSASSMPFRLSKSDFPIFVENQSIAPKIFSNQYVSVPWNQINSAYSDSKYLVSTPNNANNLRFRNRDCNTFSEFKETLASNPMTLYYPLAEPVLEEITDTILIEQLDAILNVMSYYKQTNITVESEGLNPILKFNYKKSGRAKDEEQDRRIEELEERIAQLEQG